MKMVENGINVSGLQGNIKRLRSEAENSQPYSHLIPPNVVKGETVTHLPDCSMALPCTCVATNRFVGNL
jgi:hypothetical protein